VASISQPHLRVLLLCLLSVALVLGLDHAGSFLTRLELQSLDWRFTSRGPLPPDPDIVLVTVDQKSLTEVGKWPWPRSYHAELVDTLRRQGAAVIAFDLFFSERQDTDEDAAFAAAIRRAGNVFLAADLPKQSGMGHGSNAGQEAVEVSPDRVMSSDAMIQKSPPSPTPLPAWLPEPAKEFFWTLPIPGLLEAARGVGYVDLPADPDAIYRRAQLLRPVDVGRLYPHLGLLVAAQKLGVDPKSIRAGADRQISLGSKRRIPVSDEGTFLIDFAGPPPRYRRYSYSEVLALSPRYRERGKEMEVGGIPPDAFRGKIVFVGATAPGLSDRRASPYSQVNVGLESDANLTRAILEERYFTDPGPWFLVLLLVTVGVIFGWVLAVQSLLRGTLATLAVVLGYGTLSFWLFDRAHVVLPMASPLVTLGLCYSSAMAYRSQAEHRERVRYQASLEQMERERMRHELEIGRTIQASLLPPTPIIVGSSEIDARYYPATEVGGDFYNIFLLEGQGSRVGVNESGAPAGDADTAPGPSVPAPSTLDPRPSTLAPRPSTLHAVGIAIGDVAGKGLQAAMFMTVATTLVEELARQGLTPAETLGCANERLYPKLRPHRVFVTLLYGVLDADTGQFTFSSAGQAGPILCPRGAPPRFLQSSNLPLAAMPSVQYDEQTCRLESGDALLLVSDGLIEARTTAEAPLGYTGLLEVVAGARDACPQRWLEQIWEVVSKQSEMERDDATMILVQRREP
jgi:CHASE2 domain-containing sensor protein/serine phosphatase RsbU (regulator of sigma subunit)